MTKRKPRNFGRLRGLLSIFREKKDMNSITQISVPFHGANLLIVEYNGQPYTPMKPIVDGMGLDWKSQFVKLKDRFDSTMVEITTVANDGKERLMICLPVRKLAAWLYSIHANKVKAELRDKVITYQNECDDVLWDYWTRGQTSNQKYLDTRIKINNRQIVELKAIVDRRCEGSVKKRTEMWHRHHQHFKVSSYKDLLAIHFNDSVTFLETMKLRSLEEEANIRNLALHMVWLSQWWSEFGNAMQQLNPKMSYGIHDHFKNGAYEARLLLGERNYVSLFQIAQTHDWQNESLDLQDLMSRLMHMDGKYSNFLSLNNIDK